MSDESKVDGQEPEPGPKEEMRRREALRKIGAVGAAGAVAAWAIPTLAIRSMEAKAAPGSKQ